MITKAIRYKNGDVKVISDDGMVKTEAIRKFIDVKDEILNNSNDDTTFQFEIDNQSEWVNISKDMWFKLDYV